MHGPRGNWTWYSCVALDSYVCSWGLPRSCYDPSIPRSSWLFIAKAWSNPLSYSSYSLSIQLAQQYVNIRLVTCICAQSKLWNLHFITQISWLTILSLPNQWIDIQVQWVISIEYYLIFVTPNTIELKMYYWKCTYVV